jgi:hypothetical protein
LNGQGSGETKSTRPLDPRLRKLPRGTSITTPTSIGCGAGWSPGGALLRVGMRAAYSRPVHGHWPGPGPAADDPAQARRTLSCKGLPRAGAGRMLGR